MKESSPYLDIYKNQTIVLQLGKDVFIEKDSDDFFKYLDVLKNKKINIVLLDEKGKKIFNSDGNNYFLDEQKENVNDNISNILMLENDYEIREIEGKIVEFISLEKLKEILNGKHEKIKIDFNKNKELFKKLSEIKKLLENGVNKVTLTCLGGIKEELEGFGTGTMFVNLEKAKFNKLDNFELFKEIYNYQIKEGNWKERLDEELNELFENYQVLELDGTILGGFALTNFEININGKNIEAKLLENLFATRTGGGIGETLGDEIKKENNIFAYSKREKYFNNLGFKKIEGEKSETGAYLWYYEKS